MITFPMSAMATSKITRNRKMRSTPQARRLIRAYIKCYGTERKAAAALHMTQGQLSGIKSGRLKDTPAMQIALDRADARARRAWLKVDHEPQIIDAPATLRAASRALEQAQTMIKMILKTSREDT